MARPPPVNTIAGLRGELENMSELQAAETTRLELALKDTQAACAALREEHAAQIANLVARVAALERVNAASPPPAMEVPFYVRAASSFTGEAQDPGSTGLTKEEQQRLLFNSVYRVKLSEHDEAFLDVESIVRMTDGCRSFAAANGGKLPSRLLSQGLTPAAAAEVMRQFRISGKPLPSSSQETYDFLDKYVRIHGRPVLVNLNNVEGYYYVPEGEPSFDNVNLKIDTLLLRLDDALAASSDESLQKATTRAQVIFAALKKLPPRLSEAITVRANIGTNAGTVPASLSWKAFCGHVKALVSKDPGGLFIEGFTALLARDFTVARKAIGLRAATPRRRAAG